VTDDPLEALLARYRPIARVPPLRPPREGRTWPWAVAAAALLAITVGLHAAVPPAPEPPPDARRVQALTEQLGGGDEVRAMAERIVRAEAVRDAALGAEAPWPAGVSR
jgi:hypothetical protein